MKDELPRLLQDVLYGSDHRLLDDDLGEAVLRNVDAGVADEFVRGVLSERVRKHKIAQAFSGPFQMPHLHTGDLTPGFDQWGRGIRFPVQYLNGHALTIGGSGSGKTTKTRFLVLQIASKVLGLWLFDLRKAEFSILRPYLKRIGVELIVLKGRHLRLNPLQIPEGVHPSDWAPRVADMLVQVLDLPPRATKLLHTTLLRLYQSFGTLGDSAKAPCLFDLREAIANDAQANAQSRQAIVDSLDPVLLSIGSVLAYRRGWSGEDLATRPIVFELGGLSEVDKDLILNSLLLSVFASRIARGVSNPKMDLWICCDEAQRLASSSSQTHGLSDLIGLVRGTGIGLDLSLQSADVMPSILSNTACKFVGRCGSASDYDTIGSAMGLTTDQRRWMALNLKPGEFIGQVGEGDWRHPFFFRVPPMNIQRLPDPDPNRGLDELRRLPVEPASEFLNWPQNGGAASVDAPSTSQSPGGTPGLSEADVRYLKAVIDQPGKPSSIYPKIAQIGQRRAQEIRRRLVSLGYLREHTVNTGKRGRAAIVLEPLESAHDAVRAATGGTP